MKNTIYKAIQKQLVIDDNDSSVQYSKATMSSTIFGLQSFSDLWRLFMENNEDLFETRQTLYDIITIIFSNGDEIQPCDYIKYRSTHKNGPILLKIRFDELKDQKIDYILLPAYFMHHWMDGQQWIKMAEYKIVKNTPLDEKSACYDFNGYEHTEEIINDGKHYGVADYCVNKIMTTTDGKRYAGYLPASGEVYLLLKYKKMIDYIYQRIGITSLGKFLRCWTSTEYDAQNVWLGDAETTVLKIHDKYCECDEYDDKHTYTIYTLPFFREK